MRRLIEHVINAGRLDLIEEFHAPAMAAGARHWIGPFVESFPGVQMDLLELTAEGGKVVGRFRCSATNLGFWRGQPPTGRRFEHVDEVYIYRVQDGQITEAWGNRSRERQLGLSLSR